VPPSLPLQTPSVPLAVSLKESAKWAIETNSPRTLPHLVQLSQRFCNSVEQIVQELMSILLIRTAEHFCMKLTIMYKQEQKKKRDAA
jgi:hypothetical protein